MIKIFGSRSSYNGKEDQVIIEIIRGKSRYWHFRIKGYNGKIVCFSENYKTKSNCIRIATKLAKTTVWKIREKDQK